MSFEGAIDLYYGSKDVNSRKNIKFEIDEDVNLTTLFGYFIEFTRLIGYQEGSWDNVIQEFIADAQDGDFKAFEWAMDTIYG